MPAIPAIPAERPTRKTGSTPGKHVAEQAAEPVETPIVSAARMYSCSRIASTWLRTMRAEPIQAKGSAARAR